MLFRLSVLLAATVLCSACQLVDIALAEPPPDSIALLPGYWHVAGSGIDTTIGRIWKLGGPEIDYEIGGFSCPLTALPDIISVSTTLVGEDELTIAKQTEGRFGLEFQNATFEVSNVWTQQDLDDVIRIVTTYSDPDWPEIRRQLKQAK
jgi:hypothetical protein